MGQESLLGRTGVVRTALSPVGTVQLGGELWTAELDDGDESLPAGTRVRVVRAEGIRLFVRKSG
jgi:membrane protein implicated in regulation of membrane protease activity